MATQRQHRSRIGIPESSDAGDGNRRPNRRGPRPQYVAKRQRNQHGQFQIEENVWPDWADAWLEAYRNTGSNMRAACDATGVDRNTVESWKVRVPALAAATVQAQAEAFDSIQREIYRRAVEGVNEPVFYLGEKVATIKKYSDTLLIYLAKIKGGPEWRQDQRREVSGPNGGPIDQRQVVIHVAYEPPRELPNVDGD